METPFSNFDKVLDVLLMLQDTSSDKNQLILCACEIAERSLPRFERYFPTDERPREALEAARRWALDPTENNKNAAKMAGTAASTAAHESEFYDALYAALTAAYIAKAVSIVV